jgi:hypothetical protein
MAASVQTVVDVANLGLARIGYKKRIGTVYDGSDAAKLILTVYAQTRDALLVDGNWGFAERNVLGVLLKSAPVGGYFPPATWNPATNPAVPWRFSYQYPSDALKVRAVKPVSLFTPNYDPQPWPYSIDNDNAFTPPQRVILSNVQAAVIVYTGQITDPTTWDVEFVEACAAQVARRVAPGLVGMDGVKMIAADANMEQQIAEETQE